jgi:hypothetical protein
MHEHLIQRLQNRIRRTPSTDLECVPAIQPRVALTPDKIERAELELGFMLPSLLRSLYLQVANGGYGPGWGILPIDEIVEWDHVCRANWDDVFPPRNWPDKLIRFCEWGCNFWSGIDCSSERCAIIRFDPDKDVIQIADHLVPECDLLSEWLTAWLDGHKLWDRVGWRAELKIGIGVRVAPEPLPHHLACGSALGGSTLGSKRLPDP